MSLTEPSGGNWTPVDPSAWPASNPGAAATIPTDAGDPDNNYVDGEPPLSQTVSTQGQARRLMKIAIADCASHSFQGNATIPAKGSYVEIFITEESGGASNQAEIHGEIVRGLTAKTSLEFHGNVRLVE